MAIGITNAGGVNAWAMVLVNYPSGSTLTATNVSGKKDISATQRLYYVKKPSGETQTCVFTITDGTHTKTQTVSGITIGTSRTLNLTYALYLLSRGILPSTETDVDLFGYYSLSLDVGDVVYNCTNNMYTTMYLKQRIAIVNYSTLNLKILGGRTHGAYQVFFGISSSEVVRNDEYTSNFNVVSSGFIPNDLTFPYTASIPLPSGLTDSYYIGISLAGTNNFVDTKYSHGGIKIDSFYLE